MEIPFPVPVDHVDTESQNEPSEVNQMICSICRDPETIGCLVGSFCGNVKLEKQTHLEKKNLKHLLSVTITISFIFVTRMVIVIRTINMVFVSLLRDTIRILEELRFTGCLSWCS